MGHLSLGDLAGGMRHERTISPRRRAIGPAGIHGMGSLAGKKSKKAYWAAVAQQNEDDALSKIRTLQGRMDAHMRKIRQIAQKAQGLVLQIEAMASQGDVTMINAQQAAQTTAYDIQAILDEAETAYQTFDDDFNAKRSASRGGFFAVPLVAKAESAESKIETLAGRIARAATGLTSAFARLRAQVQKQQGAAQAAAQAQAAQIAAQERARQRELEMEERRYQDQLRREEEQRRREEEARQREMQYQEQLRREEQEREEREREREAAEERRRREAEQARIDAELRREQMAIEAEQRRYAMEQERLLREEERELRKEEREAELQRLVMMQELAAKGVPVDLAPPGAAAVGPQVPGFAYPGAPPMGFPGMPSPFMPPGAAMMPGYPGMPAMPSPYGAVPVMPGAPGPMLPRGAPSPATAWAATGQVPYAAQPPQPMAPPAPAAPAPAPPPTYQQSAPLGPPASSAPPGMQWASFDPSGEMFGLGALMPTSNPRLRGGQIEQGYVLRGPLANNLYELFWAVDGPEAGAVGKGQYTEAELMAGPIVDPKADPKKVANRIIWVPPAQTVAQKLEAEKKARERKQAELEAARDAALNQQIAKGVFGTLTAGAQAAGGYLAAREQRKAAKYAARAGGGAGYPGGYSPSPAALTPRRRRGGGAGPVLVIASLGVGAIFLAAATKKPKKKKASE